MTVLQLAFFCALCAQAHTQSLSHHMPTIQMPMPLLPLLSRLTPDELTELATNWSVSRNVRSVWHIETTNHNVFQSVPANTHRARCVGSQTIGDPPFTCDSPWSRFVYRWCKIVPACHYQTLSHLEQHTCCLHWMRMPSPMTFTWAARSLSQGARNGLFTVEHMAQIS